MKKVVKILFKTLAFVLGIIILAAVAFVAYLSITEYRPADTEPAAVEGTETAPLNKPSFTVLSWNVGYCGLGEESDFFMDGGTQVHPLSQELVEKNLTGINTGLRDLLPDFVLLQEVDTDSTRSGLDEKAALSSGWTSTYALNFSTKFVPYPWPPIGKVNSGLLTLSRYGITEASRISLPCPFTWPTSMVNLHLEAYDSGEGKIAQSRQLREFLEQEYKAGNYVIAGGDWNQIFPDSEQTWPNTHVDLWTPGYLDESELSEGWRYVWDDSVPTCRLLNQPYDPADSANTQYYVIDGFLVSPNLNVDAVQTLDEGFAFTDHNPVKLTVTLGE